MISQIISAINIYILILTIAFIVWLQFKLMSGNNKKENKLSDFLKEEDEANFARKKEIPKTFFVSPDTLKLPIVEYSKDDETFERLAQRQQKALKLSKKQMIRPNHNKTNKEIKNEFGVSNLETFTNGEETFHSYIVALIDWAEQLVKFAKLDDAKKVLLHAIDFGCDISKGFLLLTDVYIKQRDRKGLSEFVKKISNDDFSNLSKEVKDKLLVQIEEKSKCI